MKKLVAFFFLGLICVANISNEWRGCQAGYEITSDSDRAELENKEGKKEIKEFTTANFKKIFTQQIFLTSYKLSQSSLSPAPLIFQPTPPPDFAC